MERIPTRKASRTTPATSSGSRKLGSAGCGRSTWATRTSPPAECLSLVECACRYVSPAKGEDLVTVDVWVVEISAAAGADCARDSAGRHPARHGRSTQNAFVDADGRPRGGCPSITPHGCGCRGCERGTTASGSRRDACARRALRGEPRACRRIETARVQHPLEIHDTLTNLRPTERSGVMILYHMKPLAIP